MNKRLIVFKYELFNVLRSKWLYCYVLLLALATFGFIKISEDARRVELSLVTLVSVVVPLISVLFTTTYWYNAERFTDLLLSQPVSRRRLFISRLGALSIALSLCTAAGLGVTAIGMQVYDAGLWWVIGGSVFLNLVYCFIGALIAVCVSDKMWGIGLALGIWFYCAAIHDALLMVMLLGMREYPMDMWSAFLSGINPIGLARVSLLMHFDAPLLLGHSGALIRRLIEQHTGFWYAAAIVIVWIFVPGVAGLRRFLKRDF